MDEPTPQPTPPPTPEVTPAPQAPQTPPTPAPRSTQQRSSFWSFLGELLRTIVIVGAAGLLIRYYVLQPFIVDGESMAPELHTNDYLYVDKLDYHIKSPQRGDIVVFKYPLNTSINYVKRIIGLPGETVSITDSKVTISNAAHPEGFLLQENYLPAATVTRMLNGAPSATFTVPSNSYFVLGDNRDNSSDSREWGMLPKVDLIGRVAFRAFPLNEPHLIVHAKYTF